MVYEHGCPRFAEGIALLLSTKGLERFHHRLVGRGYRPVLAGAEKTFRDTETGVRFEIITAGEFPGDGLPKPLAFPDPEAFELTSELDGIRVITLERFIELTLASGTSASHRLWDLADVQDLIIHRDLSRTFGNTLDPSVRAVCRELSEETQEGIR